MADDIPALITISGMALVTYATRAGGLWLMGHMDISPRLEAGLRHLPGAMLAALLAPSAMKDGPAEIIAMIVTVLIAARTKNLLLAMATGVGMIWLMRNIILIR